MPLVTPERYLQSGDLAESTRLSSLASSLSLHVASLLVILRVLIATLVFQWFDLKLVQVDVTLSKVVIRQTGLLLIHNISSSGFACSSIVVNTCMYLSVRRPFRQISSEGLPETSPAYSLKGSKDASPEGFRIGPRDIQLLDSRGPYTLFPIDLAETSHHCWKMNMVSVT